jgi:hypothetical protein
VLERLAVRPMLRRGGGRHYGLLDGMVLTCGWAHPAARSSACAWLLLWEGVFLSFLLLFGGAAGRCDRSLTVRFTINGTRQSSQSSQSVRPYVAKRRKDVTIHDREEGSTFVAATEESRESHGCEPLSRDTRVHNAAGATPVDSR